MSRERKIFILLFIGLILGSFFIGHFNREIQITKDTIKEVADSVTGNNTKCQNPMRPVAIMLSSDKEARPLAGIAQADIVFEMPVTDNGITRMMAVYYCNKPVELGSVRSARLDFIPLAQGLGAIYAHWGGEHTALEQLNSGVIDNIDGLKYEGIYYYRKKVKYGAPHNGFISFDNIEKGISKLNYKTEAQDIPYNFSNNEGSKGAINPPSFYKGALKVDWVYDPKSNSYKRNRADIPETDATTKTTVEAKNIIAMYTTWSPIDKNYIRVRTLGSGDVVLYSNGQEIKGTWKKEKAEDQLLFYDLDGKPMKFIPGNIWIEILI